jgi:GT2 family glycosyltransferase
LRRSAAERALRGGASDLYRLFNSVLDVGSPATSNIVHLPGSTATLPSFDVNAAEKGLATATKAHLQRRGVVARTAPNNGVHLPAVRVTRESNQFRVSIIISTRNQEEQLQHCITSILTVVKTLGAELIIVDGDSADPDALEQHAEIDGTCSRVLRVPGPFNLARSNNRAAEVATGDVICLLGNGIRARNGDWLEDMLGRIVEKDVGAVGALLLWPSGVVQHGGIVLGPGFSAAPAFNDRMVDDCGYGGLLSVAHECSAVTAACLVTRRSDYLQVGGMDELRFPMNFSDIDYCLKLRALGKRTVFTPHAQLVHLKQICQGSSLQLERTSRFERELQNLRAKWGSVLSADPYYNPVLSLDPVPFSALAWPVRSTEPRTNGRPVPNRVPTII